MKSVDFWGELRDVDPAPMTKQLTHEQKTIERMHALYGKSPLDTDKCGGCAFLRTKSGDMQGSWYKCGKFTEAYRTTHQGPGCESTDWRRKWRACGKYQDREAT